MILPPPQLYVWIYLVKNKNNFILSPPPPPRKKKEKEKFPPSHVTRVYASHLVAMRILVRPFAVYGAGVVQHRAIFGRSQPLAGHVRRQYFGASGDGGRGCGPVGQPEVLRARERVRPRVRRDHLRVAGRVRAAVTVGVAHRRCCSSSLLLLFVLADGVRRRPGITH